MGLERVLALLVAILVSMATIQAATITKRRAPLTQYYQNELEEKMPVSTLDKIVDL